MLFGNITEKLADYFGYLVPSEFLKRGHKEDLWLPPVFIFLIVFVIKWFTREDLLFSFLGAFLIAVYFGLGNFFIFEFIFHRKILQNEQHKGAFVWEIWLMAFCGFVLGHLFWNVGNFIFGMFGLEVLQVSGTPDYFFKTLPIWFIIVLIVVSLAKNRQLTEELERLEDINSLLENRRREKIITDKPEMIQENTVLFLDVPEGQIPFQKISHISIEEHYCRIVTQTTEQNFEEIIVRMTLKTILDKLPEKLFLQIHRSHLINLDSVNHIDKRSRSYEITLGNGHYHLPISRNRVADVLPKLEQILGLNRVF
jgi:DNA-binding LytR/AlgR family response regulator